MAGHSIGSIGGAVGIKFSRRDIFLLLSYNKMEQPKQNPGRLYRDIISLYKKDIINKKIYGDLFWKNKLKELFGWDDQLLVQYLPSYQNNPQEIFLSLLTQTGDVAEGSERYETITNLIPRIGKVGCGDPDCIRLRNLIDYFLEIDFSLNVIKLLVKELARNNNIVILNLLYRMFPKNTDELVYSSLEGAVESENQDLIVLLEKIIKENKLTLPIDTKDPVKQYTISELFQKDVITFKELYYPLIESLSLQGRIDLIKSLLEIITNETVTINKVNITIVILKSLFHNVRYYNTDIIYKTLSYIITNGTIKQVVSIRDNIISNYNTVRSVSGSDHISAKYVYIINEFNSLVTTKVPRIDFDRLSSLNTYQYLPRFKNMKLLAEIQNSVKRVWRLSDCLPGDYKIGEIIYDSDSIIYSLTNNTNINMILKSIILTDSESVYKFRSEVEITELMSNNKIGPHIYGHTECLLGGLHHGLIWMQRLDGTLRDIKDMMSKMELSDMIRQLEDKIFLMHKLDIVHTDLRGGNISYIKTNNNISWYIIDFGDSYHISIDHDIIWNWAVSGFGWSGTYDQFISNDYQNWYNEITYHNVEYRGKYYENLAYQDISLQDQLIYTHGWCYSLAFELAELLDGEVWGTYDDETDFPGHVVVKIKDDIFIDIRGIHTKVFLLEKQHNTILKNISSDKELYDLVYESEYNRSPICSVNFKDIIYKLYLLSTEVL